MRVTVSKRAPAAPSVSEASHHLGRARRGTGASAAAKLAPAPKLPRPGHFKGKSLAKSLRQRRTIREIRDEALPKETLSNLLWAACGVNRAKGPFGAVGITAASASNSQEIDVFVATEKGVFRYDAAKHRLVPVVTTDVRGMTLGPGQKVPNRAPVQLIFVVDVHRLSHTKGFQEPGLQDPEVQQSYYFVDTGLIAGNVYLFAASQGLAAWFHNCDREGLKKQLKLGPEQRVLFAQSVGYPAT